MQSQAPRDNVAGQIRQHPIMSIRVGAQPDKCLRDADAELLGEHPGGLIDLGAVPGQFRGLAAWARPGRPRRLRDAARRLVLSVEQQQGRSIGEEERVPQHMKLRHGEGKYIVKKAIEGLVPHEIIYRTKMGFPTPLRQWLRDPRAGNIFQIMRAKDGLLASCIDPAALDNLLHLQVSGRQDATDRIWRLLTLQLWGDMFLTGKRQERWEGVMSAAHPAL